MGHLDGSVSIRGLPSRRGLSISVAFYEVPGTDAAPPYGGDPPADAVTDSLKVFDDVDLDRETGASDFRHGFHIEHKTGCYYIQLRMILFRKQEGKVFAQVEQFFFGRRPLVISDEPGDPVTFPVAWPQIPLAEFSNYGTIAPQRKGWWARLFG